MFILWSRGCGARLSPRPLPGTVGEMHRLGDNKHYSSSKKGESTSGRWNSCLNQAQHFTRERIHKTLRQSVFGTVCWRQTPRFNAKNADPYTTVTKKVLSNRIGFSVPLADRPYIVFASRSKNYETHEVQVLFSPSTSLHPLFFFLPLVIVTQIGGHMSGAIPNRTGARVQEINMLCWLRLYNWTGNRVYETLLKMENIKNVARPPQRLGYTWHCRKKSKTLQPSALLSSCRLSCAQCHLPS